jgi:hypothetical protein
VTASMRSQRLLPLRRFLRCWEGSVEDGEWRTPVHVLGLVRLIVGVMPQLGVQVLLHLIESLVPFDVSLGQEVLIEEGAMQALNKAVALGTPWPNEKRWQHPSRGSCGWVAGQGP